MEAPSSWTKARNAIWRGINKAAAEMKAGGVGLSEPAIIESELNKEGFLTPASQVIVGFQDPHAEIDTHSP